VLQWGSYGRVRGHLSVGGGVDIVSRLIAWAVEAVLLLVLFVLLVVSAGEARATGVVASGNAGQTCTWTIASGAGAGTHASPAAACAAWASGSGTSSNTQQPYVCTSSGSAYSGSTCVNASLTVSAGSPDIYSQTATVNITATAAGCPSNSTLSGGVCTCNTGFNANTGATACVAQGTSSCDVLTRAANAAGLNYTVQPALPAGTLSFCNGGCSMTANFAGTSPTGTTFSPPFTYAGTSCSGNGTGSTAADAPVQCTVGQCPGTVNGVAVCVPCSSATSAGTKSTTLTGTGTAPTGLATGTEQTATTCTGSQCTTVKTYRDATGAVTATTSDTTPKVSFCEENPEISICKDSSIAQSCSAGAASQNCTGDAVQCAIAQEQYKRNCQLFEQTGATRTIGEEAIARGDTKASDHPGATGNITTTSVGSMVDTTDLISGSCPADQSVSMPGGRSVVMPWSQICTPAGWLGNLLVGLTSLAWVFIAFKRG